MRLALTTLLVLTTAGLAAGQSVTEADYQRAERMLAEHTRSLVYGTSLTPNWLDDGSFWYRFDDRDGKRFMRVDPDARRNRKREAFDHVRLAEAIEHASGDDADPTDLPFDSFEYGRDYSSIMFDAGPNRYTCSIRRYTCSIEDAPEGTDEEESPFARFRRTEIPSPDGRLEAFIREHNLWVRETDGGQEKQLTFDGIEDYGYATNNAGWRRGAAPVVLWSPDSRKIATFRHDGRGVSMMYLTSTERGAPELDVWRYPFPGDSLIFRIERLVIHVDDARMVRLDMPPDAHRSTITDHVVFGEVWADVEWSADSERLFFVSSSRDHKVAELREADPETGAVRDIHREVEETFYESGYRNINWTVLEDTEEFIWYSQETDWGHLYLRDLQTGALANAVTRGEWKVLAVQHLDEENRVVFLSGAGREPGDPYFEYLYRADLDGGGVTLLTPDSLNHSWSFSPDYRYFVDTASSPDTPQTHTLRSAEDGGIIAELEHADITELLASGWKPPIPFMAKARDEQTDIYGLMYTPTHLDEGGSYPVLNYLYPGPQSGSVGSRAFTPARSDKQAVSELGFVVVELDAMGSPMRSKSFHEAYYGNMGDNGLPDQIAGIRQLAARHRFMDTERVGIWGHSGGGFASTAGILRYPDFYKVAVSGAGNHDNATYEDDWGEKWHGLLVNNEDGSTTYDNQANHLLAENLKGKLLLAHGTMDSNVPPNNTLLVAEALMNANKDFDMLMFPNSGHRFRQFDYWTRRRWDYFVKHLIGAEPPREFEFGQQ